MDLTPDIQIPLTELNLRMKQRAAAILAEAGISSFDAIGGAFWADLLYVTCHERAQLDAQQLESLSKASTGLGYAPAQFALLSDADSNTPVEIYAQALCAGTVVFLEAKTASPHLATFFDLQGNNTKNNRQARSQDGTQDDFRAAESYIKTLVVTDFFDSLNEGKQQDKKKKQAWLELQPAKLLPAMR